MAARPPGGIPRYYIDSCIFIEVIRGKTNSGVDHPDHYDDCLQLFDRLERREIEVWASTLVYVEVFHRGEMRLTNKAKSQPVSAGVRQEAGNLIDQWFRHSRIRWVEMHLDLVEDARAMTRRTGCGSQDAVHLCSAIDAGCTRLYTLDQRLINDVNAAGGIDGLDVLLPAGDGQQAIVI